MSRTPAWKRYNVRVIWLSLAYAGLLVAAVYTFKHKLVTDWWSISSLFSRPFR